MSCELSEEQITELARPLYRIVTEFFSDPKNEEAYQKWLLEEKAKQERKQNNEQRTNNNPPAGRDIPQAGENV